jgi:hypothetical protein
MLAHKLPDEWELKLLERLNSTDPECSVEAVRQLRGLDPEQVAALVRRAVCMQRPWIRRAALLALVPALVGGALVFQAGALSAPVMLGVVIVGAVLLVTSAILFHMAPVRSMSECFRLLAIHIGSQSNLGALPWLLGMLGEAVEQEFPVVLRRGLRTGVAKILPCVTGIEFEQLRSVHRELLAGILSRPYDHTRLTLAAIDVMARLSDPFDRGLSARLQNLARQGAVTSNMRQVRIASQNALVQLDERQARHVESHSLLRSAGGQQACAAGELLRPTSPAAAMPSEQMVRASTSPEDPDISMARNSELG